MSPGARTRRARSRSRRSRNRRRPVVVIAAALLGGMAAGYVLVNVVGDQIREVTLPLRHEDIIRQQSREKALPPQLVAAVIFSESRFRDQESRAGARGLMQVTPQTAELIEGLSGGSTFETDDLSDPDINIRYGTFYLRYLLDKFDQNLTAALAAYNAGETNVASWGGAGLVQGDIEFAETREYVQDVLDKRDEYRRHYADELGID